MKNIKSYVLLPFATADGHLIKAPGYHAATETYAEFNEDEFNEVSDKPTRSELIQALKLIWRPWQSYKFATDHDRAAMLATIIGAVCRSGLNIAPGTVFDAPMAGSGKTLAAQAVGSLILGRRSPILVGANFGDEDEIRKSLIADAIAGTSVTIFDNLHGHLANSAIEGLITASTLSGRVLGTSDMFQGEVRSTILLTSNNASLSSDLSRRFLRVRIDHGVERPQSLEFQHCPVERALAERLIIARSVLILISGYWAAESPIIGKGDAGFPQWNHLIRQSVLWLSKEGITEEAGLGVLGDPAYFIQEAAGRSDPESQALAMLLGGLNEEFKYEWFQAREVVYLLESSHKESASTVLEAIEILTPNRRSPITSGVIGNILKFRIDRPVHGLVLRKRDGGKNTSIYCVEPA